MGSAALTDGDDVGDCVVDRDVYELFIRAGVCGCEQGDGDGEGVGDGMSSMVMGKGDVGTVVARLCR